MNPDIFPQYWDGWFWIGFSVGMIFDAIFGPLTVKAIRVLRQRFRNKG